MWIFAQTDGLANAFLTGVRRDTRGREVLGKRL